MKINSFNDFYPYYLSQHRNGICRLCHLIGSLGVLTLLGYGLATAQYMLLLWIPVLGYGFAWIGHFVFEKNKPATFGHFNYSLWGDWVMMKDILTFRIPLLGDLPEEFWTTASSSSEEAE
ncbi:MAG TPA: DUF962 domain-containing protein [Myxococcales bacterium]|nr:DUF962 domain-containing protein [Myxococcales bacterium]HIN84944.1 DUF962 domain-containing protein [Myxococcales bacterium]